MKALIYARQSSGKDDVSESVEAQINNCRCLAAKENLEIVGIYKDLNTSGETYPVGTEAIAQLDSAYQTWVAAQSSRKTFRPGLGEAIAMFGTIDVLLVNEMTRLYRPINGSFLEGHINQLLKENHVKVLQVQGGSIDLTKFDQQLITMIKNQILYEDLQKKRTNSMIAFRNKRDSGKFCTGCRVYGIRYLGNDKLEVIPECVKVIQFVFDGICAHRSYRSIIRECNDRWGKEQKIFFYESSIYHIAQQPLYAGYQYNSNHELIKNVQITGQEIITFDQWQQAHEIVSAKRKNYRTQEKKHSLPLSGRLYCGNCGGRLVVGLDHGKIYYVCNKRTLATDHLQCRVSRIRFTPGRREKNVALFDAIYPLLTIAIFVKLRKYNDILQAKNEISNYEEKLKKMQKEVEDTYDLVASGLATMTEVRNILLRQKIRKEELLQKIAEAKASCITEDYLKDAEATEFKTLMTQIRDKTLSNEKYAELVGIVDIRVTVFRDHVNIHTAFGEFSLPRIMVKNYHCLPESRIEITLPPSRNFNDGVKATIFYRTGKSKTLARWEGITIKTE